MEKFVKHRFLNSVLFTALFVPLGFFFCVIPLQQ